jgi:hypothetical protein
MEWNGENGPVERVVEASDLKWTFLQPVEFMSNALQWAETIRLKGIVREPYGDSPSAMIHVTDITSVAVAALIGDGHAGKTYTLTGPEVLTVFDKVRILGEAIGRHIQFFELTEDQARERMREQGAPEDAIDFVLGWYANPPKSAYTVVTTVEQVTGRPARTFAQWVSEHVQYFKNPYLRHSKTIFNVISHIVHFCMIQRSLIARLFMLYTVFHDDIPPK